MELEDIVCSLESSKKFKILGFKQESLFYWLLDHNNNWIIVDRITADVWSQGGKYYNRVASAYTVAELGMILPKGYRSYYYDGHPSGGTWMCNDDKIIGVADAPTEAEARAKMLISLAESGLIKADGVKGNLRTLSPCPICKNIPHQIKVDGDFHIKHHDNCYIKSYQVIPITCIDDWEWRNNKT